jgi:hypothetical protein
MIIPKNLLISGATFPKEIKLTGSYYPFVVQPSMPAQSH